MTRLLSEERKTVAMLTKELDTWRQGNIDDQHDDQEAGHDDDEAMSPPPYDHKDHMSPTARRIREKEEMEMLKAVNAQLQQGNETIYRTISKQPFQSFFSSYF